MQSRSCGIGVRERHLVEFDHDDTPERSASTSGRRCAAARASLSRAPSGTDIDEGVIGLGAAIAGARAIRMPTTGSRGMLGKANGENETVSPGRSSALATAIATSATRPEPATIHSGWRHGSGR